MVTSTSACNLTAPCPAGVQLQCSLLLGPDHMPLSPSRGRPLASASNEVFEGAVCVACGCLNRVPQAGRLKTDAKKIWVCHAG